MGMFEGFTSQLQREREVAYRAGAAQRRAGRGFPALSRFQQRLGVAVILGIFLLAVVALFVFF